ncbi:serine--tRNA ligase [Longirhabdus pacifica]|uniref:serine--tRNA ligase n=1 Tax=Longirhabdus pacifica TaxID=2305227 RepID=UPI001008B87E|nr:serine--tRNA ligase [Longirhabdus pacifica]
MLDMKRIRKEQAQVEAALKKRMDNVDLTPLVQIDEERRAYIQQVEKLKMDRNTFSKQIGMLKGDTDASDQLNNMKSYIQNVNEQITQIETKLKHCEEQQHDMIVQLPNIPEDDVPAGGKENNQVMKQWGEKPTFDFEWKDHMALAKTLHIIDYERGAKLGGSGHWMYASQGAQLEWALLNFFIDTHIKNGYQFILPPHILNEQCGYSAGQFPKFKEDVFYTDDRQHFLLPTSETALVNVHRDEIVQLETLPTKYVAYTPCYRREAGSYGANERGMIRGHQFNKVELVQLTTPQQSDEALNEMLHTAEHLVQQLELHYQVTKLAAKDCSHSMAKTFDVEVWIPSMNEYKEVSSASNAKDYQARRGNIRFKEEGNATQYVHTLNASALATSRLVPALLEQHQQQDGSVKVPKALHKWLGSTLLSH